MNFSAEDLLRIFDENKDDMDDVLTYGNFSKIL